MHRQRERERCHTSIYLPSKKFPKAGGGGGYPRRLPSSPEDFCCCRWCRQRDRRAGRQDGRHPVRLLAKVAPFLLWESPHDCSRRRRLLATRPPSFEGHRSAFKCLGDHFCPRFLCSRRSLAPAYLPYPFPLSNFATRKHSRGDRRSNSPSWNFLGMRRGGRGRHSPGPSPSLSLPLPLPM